MGHLDEAIEDLTPPAGTSGVPAHDEPWPQWWLFGCRATALLYSGRLGEAEELIVLADRQFIDHPAAEARAFVAMQFAYLHPEQGRPMSAFRRASESYTLFQQLGRSVFVPSMYAVAALALATMGRAKQAAETLAALDGLAPPIDPAPPVEGALLQARAWTAASAGDLPTARVRLEEAADYAQEIGSLIYAAGALHDLARLGHARAVAGRLNEIAIQVDGECVTARAAYASAIATSDSLALDQVSEAFERMGANLYAAEASAEVAAVLRHDGRPREAGAAENRAAQLLSRCEGATTPAVSSIAARARLTASELDAAQQAAAGRSNKQIAADNSVSVRTVENHLQRVYEKLGISSRRELTEALRDQLGT